MENFDTLSNKKVPKQTTINFIKQFSKSFVVLKVKDKKIVVFKN